MVVFRKSFSGSFFACRYQVVGCFYCFVFVTLVLIQC